MEIKLDAKTVRQIASRARNLVGPSGMSHSQSLEAAAKLLGHYNWDTLSGLMKKTEAAPNAASFELKKPFSMFLTASAVEENQHGPSWAKLTVDQSFIDAVVGLHQLCALNGLASVNKPWAVDEWEQVQAKADGEERYYWGDECQVDKRSFQMVSMDDYISVHTSFVDIAQFFETAKTGKTAGAGFTWVNDILLFDNCYYDVSRFVEELVDAGSLPATYLTALD
jgi:hypothetical protein